MLCCAGLATAQQATTSVLLPLGFVNDTTQTYQTNLICWRGTLPVGITNATKIAFQVAGAATTCGVAIYPDSDSGAPVVTTGALGCAAGVVTATGLGPFTLTAVTTPYRICTCRSSAVGTFVSMNLLPNTATVVNQYKANVSTGANSCTGAGAPPASTGALTASTTVNPPVVLVSAE